jgi:hypothetical protein
MVTEEIIKKTPAGSIFHPAKCRIDKPRNLFTKDDFSRRILQGELKAMLRRHHRMSGGRAVFGHMRRTFRTGSALVKSTSIVYATRPAPARRMIKCFPAGKNTCLRQKRRSRRILFKYVGKIDDARVFKNVSRVWLCLV